MKIASKIVTISQLQSSKRERDIVKQRVVEELGENNPLIEVYQKQIIEFLHGFQFVIDLESYKEKIEELKEEN